MPLGISFRRDIPVRHTVDICIAGGGPAGIAAAVSAARQGRSVFLAEGQACFGGLGTAGLVPCFMRFSDGVNFLAGGIGREIIDRLVAAGNPAPVDETQRMNIRVEILKRVYDQLLMESGVDFCLMTHLLGVEKEADRVSFAILAAKSGLFAVQAKIFIDATGDGDLAAWAGAPFENGDPEGHVMPGTLCSLWANIDWDRYRDQYRRQDSRIEEAYRDKVLSVEDRHLPGMMNIGPGLGGGNIGHAFGVDGTDERSVTHHLMASRTRLLEYEQYYKKYLCGFEKMELVVTASLMGIRESRRILGEYVLNVNDFRHRAIFDDEIGRYAYPIDLHPVVADAQAYAKFLQEYQKEFRYGPGESYGIPYRILIPRGLANVLVAGRCVSTDRAMQASIRVMPGCYITGQAAGMAAALAVEAAADPRGVSVPDLQSRLKEKGAFLPHCRPA